jgi:hypothetical protein
LYYSLRSFDMLTWSIEKEMLSTLQRPIYKLQWDMPTNTKRWQILRSIWIKVDLLRGQFLS